MKRSWALPVFVCVLAVVVAGCAGLSSDLATDEPAIDDSERADVDGTLAVHNINVGQSVSTLVVGPTGETMLIDTGHFTDDGEYVLEYLRAHDIDRIDYLVTSHNDADHIGGNAAVVEYYETEADGIGAIYDPGIAASTQTYGEYLDAVEKYDVRLFRTQEGDSIRFENVSVQVLGPPADQLSGGDRNENSIVLRFEFGQTSFLYTGDAEVEQETYLVENYGSQLQSTVYKAGHHGSSSSSSDELLDAVDPEAAIISSAYDSQYGHPHDEVLQNFAERSIPAYWTATHGDAVFVSNGDAISVRTQRAAPTDPLALSDGEPIAPGTGGEVREREQIGSGSVEDSGEPGADTDDGDDTTSSGALAVQSINADADGDDRENLNDEYLVFENVGDESLDMGGWTIEDEAGKQYTVPSDFTLDAGATVTVRTGSGTDSETVLYWDAGSPVWNNGGDTVIVRTADGERVVTEEYP